MYYFWMVLVIIPYCSSIPVEDKNLEHKNDIIQDYQHQLLNKRIKRLEVVHPDNLDPDEETLKELLLVTPKPININSVYDYTVSQKSTQKMLLYLGTLQKKEVWCLMK